MVVKAAQVIATRESDLKSIDVSFLGGDVCITKYTIIRRVSLSLLWHLVALARSSVDPEIAT
jgi:hypothetical protein